MADVPVGREVTISVALLCAGKVATNQAGDKQIKIASVEVRAETKEDRSLRYIRSRLYKG